MTWEDPLTAHCSGFRTMQDNLSYSIAAQDIRGTIPSVTGSMATVRSVVFALRTDRYITAAAL